MGRKRRASRKRPGQGYRGIQLVAMREAAVRYSVAIDDLPFGDDTVIALNRYSPFIRRAMLGYVSGERDITLGAGGTRSRFSQKFPFTSRTFRPDEDFGTTQ